MADPHASASKQTTNPSATNFTAIFEAASNNYKTLTGQDLRTHPLAAELESNNNSPDSILGIFRKQAQALDKFRSGDDRLIKSLTPIVNVLFTFSATAGADIGLPFSPATVLFTGIAVLLGVVKDVIASYETLINLFERTQLFLQRLNHYITTSLTPEMTELLAKILAQVLSVLALSTKEMKDRRIKKFMKRLVGKTEVEDGLQRLDMLTKEENIMTAACTLEVAGDIRHDVSVIKDDTSDIKDDTRDIKEDTHDIKEDTRDIKDDTRDIKDDTRDIKDDTRDIKDDTQDIKEDTQNIKEDTRNINDNLELNKRAIDELQRNRSREKLRTWLAPPNPSVNHNTACDTHHDGTANWFIQGSTFDDWKKDGSLLWIRGNPGSGKSILSSAIIEDIKHMRESRSALIAYYYFDFKDAAKRDIRGLLTSLLLQLVDNSDRCWDLLSQLHKRCGNGSEQPSDAALAQCLKNMLDLPEQLPAYIVIDALDECPNNIGTPSARERVLNFVEDLVESNHSNLFICITSRPEQDITAILNPLTPPSRRVSLHEEAGQRRDIDSYVRSFVQSDRVMRRWRAEDKELVINVLSERANGMFRWVYCQLDNLRRCMPSSIRKALNELPVTLDDTYERILQNIPKQKWQHAHRLFQCMVAAIRPLRVEELAEIFAIGFGPNVAPILVEDWRPENPEEAVFSACSTLISIINDRGSKIVQFSHFSVKEYLTSDRLQTSDVGSIRNFYISLEPAHTILARACLAVLLQLEEKVVKERLSTFPLASYAARNWVDHAKFENVASLIQDAMEHLFDLRKPHFLAWVRIHDVDTPYSGSRYEKGSPSTPLYYVALCGFSGLAKHLIITHALDVNGRVYFDWTPLHAVSTKGHVDAAQVLLDCGADVNAQDTHNQIPLYWASYFGHLKVVQLLVEHGANVDIQTNYNKWTPLHAAASEGGLEVARLLLDHGADVHIRDAGGLTPFQIATRTEHHDIVQLLLDRGAERE